MGAAPRPSYYYESQTKTLFHESQSISALHGSQTKTLQFLFKKALHLLHFLTTARREWRENVWKGLPRHPFLLSSTQWFKILKRYFLGRTIHIVYLYDNTVRSDPYLTEYPLKKLETSVGRSVVRIKRILIQNKTT